jgi:hypothetical protein
MDNPRHRQSCAKDHCFHSACRIVVRFSANEAASCTSTPIGSRAAFCNHCKKSCPCLSARPSPILLLEAVEVELRNHAWILFFHCFPSDGFQFTLRVSELLCLLPNLLQTPSTQKATAQTATRLIAPRHRTQLYPCEPKLRMRQPSRSLRPDTKSIRPAASDGSLQVAVSEAPIH